MSLPQYAKSTAPEVVAAIKKNDTDRAAAIERIKEWSRERGGDGDAAVRWWGGVRVLGLPVKPEGFGRWTSNSPHRPFKNNTAEVEAMDALDFTESDVPGAVHFAWGPRNEHDWSRQYLGPALFIVDGVAYQGFSTIPDQDESADIGAQWAEIKGSEFLAAKEAWLEQRQERAS